MRKQESVAHEMKLVMNKVNRCAEASMPVDLRREVTEGQGRVLGYLYHNQGRNIFQKDVEAEFSITRATASKMLSSMEQNGLITRSGVAGDARLKRLALTEKAMSHTERLWRGMRKFEQTMTRGMTEDDQQTMIRLLRIIGRNMDAAMAAQQSRKEQ